MNKVLILGIDSLSPELLSRFEEKLPTFTRLRKESPAVELTSIFPIDSIPAWTSIFTGLNPARHGLIYSFDVFESSWNAILGINSAAIRGRTFWDHAGRGGKEVCILFPLVAYPSWPVNGTMVSRSLTGAIDSWPAELILEYSLANSEVLSGKHPGRKGLLEYAEKARQITLQEAAVASRILSTRQWDLAFTFFGMLDIIQHFFWRFFDEKDPTYPGPTLLEGVVCEFYVLLDQIVGEFIQTNPDAIVIVLSDHGHGMRPPKTVNLNEVLRKEGLLASKSRPWNPIPSGMEFFKRSALNIVHALELDHWMLKVSKKGALASITKNLYMSKTSIDMESTVAYLSSFAGPKSYPYGGIEIQKKNLPAAGLDYEYVRSRVIQCLMDLREPKTRDPLVQWAIRREDLYHGPKIDLYPDVVFELQEGYGVYWGIHTPLIGIAYEHNLAPGGHRKNAVFLAHGVTNKNTGIRRMNLMDVAPTILSLLGIDGDFGFDGRSIW